jgi:hypothetical protein
MQSVRAGPCGRPQRAQHLHRPDHRCPPDGGCPEQPSNSDIHLRAGESDPDPRGADPLRNAGCHPTPTTPTISVSVDTNCRTGPGAIFERVGILLVGETAEIVGREPKGEYWYIRNPDTGPEFCWVWGEYATISGNTLFLLYLSPAPPPPTSFTASFEKMETCSVWWMDFRLVNNSGVAFRSMSISVRDADTNTVASQQANSFSNSDGCSAPVTIESLISGGAVTVSSPPFGYNPAGHNLSASITLCTETDQKGTCVTQDFNFRP